MKINRIDNIAPEQVPPAVTWEEARKNPGIYQWDHYGTQEPDSSFRYIVFNFNCCITLDKHSIQPMDLADHNTANSYKFVKLDEELLIGVKSANFKQNVPAPDKFKQTLNECFNAWLVKENWNDLGAYYQIFADGSVYAKNGTFRDDRSFNTFKEFCKEIGYPVPIGGSVD